MTRKIKEAWNKNRAEIMDLVNPAKQTDKTDKEIEEKARKERVFTISLLLMGTVYVLIGLCLLLNLTQSDLHTAEPQNTFIGIELIILGTYPLLVAFLSYCEQERWGARRLVRGIEVILILFITPIICV